MPSESKSGFGPIADMLLPFISATKAQAGDKTVNIGPGGLLGMQDVGQNYTDYINQRERERLMTPMAKRMHYLQANLARQIGLEMGMDPQQATLAATRVSAPSVMAWGLMKANKVDDTLMKFEDALQQQGVISPFGLGGSKLPTQQYNQRVQAVLGDILTMTMNPQTANSWGNMAPNQIAEIILPRYLSGEYNDILQSPQSFDARGMLTGPAKTAMFKRMTGTTQAINELQYIFPGSEPKEAYDKMSSYFGGDPIKALGAGPTKRLFRDLRSTANSTGIKQEDMVNLMANIGSEYRKSGRDPYHALSSAKDLMLLSAASREGPNDLDPGKYNQSMIANVAAARHSPIADMMGQTYAALSDRVGDVEARRILSATVKDKKNLLEPEKFLETVNQHIKGKAYPIDAELLTTYGDSPRTKYFKASGMGTMNMLKHYAEQMQGYRKKLLRKQFGWSDDQLSYLDQIGGPTVQNIQKYMKGTGAHNPNDVRKRTFAIQSAFDDLAKNQGFEKATAADRFVSGVKNEKALNRYSAAARRSRRVASSLERRPQPGGIRGLTQYLSGDRSKGNWWEAITGSQTLNPSQIAELQGVDLNKFDKPSQNAWGKAMEGWLSPETTPNKKRVQDMNVINRMSGV